MKKERNIVGTLVSKAAYATAKSNANKVCIIIFLFVFLGE